MRIVGIWIDAWVKWHLESTITSQYTTILRKEYPKAFIRKIPDVWKKLKPCDGIRIFSKDKLYIVEVKVIKEKTWVYDETTFQSYFISKMEPLQMLTFHKCSSLWIDCLMVAYNKYTNLFYNVIYKPWQKK